MYTQKNSLRSHLRAIMTLDHSRLSVENKFLENKSGCVQTNLLYFKYTSHLRRKSTMRRCFYHTDLVQNAVVHNFSRQIAFIHYWRYSGPSKHAWTFSETAPKNFQNHLYGQPVLIFDKRQICKELNFKRVTLQHDKGLIVFIFC